MRLITCLMTALIPVAGAHAATVTVTVGNVASGEGQVRVAVCTAATFLKPRCPYNGSAPAVEGETEVRIEGIAPGSYALQAFHDANGNTDLDTNLLGLPEEGVGFSRDAPMRFGPPEFTDARVSIGDPARPLRLRLRYF